jgi:hypothetical protein
LVRAILPNDENGVNTGAKSRDFGLFRFR